MLTHFVGLGGWGGGRVQWFDYNLRMTHKTAGRKPLKSFRKVERELQIVTTNEKRTAPTILLVRILHAYLPALSSSLSA